MSTATGTDDCQDVAELLSAYLDGTLDAATRAGVDAHLALCQGCQDYLDQLRATRGALATLGLPTLLPLLAVREELLAAFRAQPR